MRKGFLDSTNIPVVIEVKEILGRMYPSYMAFSDVVRLTCFNKSGESREIACLVTTRVSHKILLQCAN